MGSNFSINPNFNMNGFQNTIDSFNKELSSSLNNVQGDLNNNFSEVFNMVQEKMNQNSQDANNFAIPELGQKQEEISPIAKMAKDFSKGFSNSINELNAVEKKAESDFETFASGGDISVHEVMISAQKSGLAMQMAIQLRNQMLNAYNEFKQMQI